MHRRRSGQRTRRPGIERHKLLSRLYFSPIFLPLRCRTGGVDESHHLDRSTCTSRRTSWRSQINLKHSGRVLHQRTVLSAHCGLGRCCVRSRTSRTASVSTTSMKHSAVEACSTTTGSATPAAFPPVAESVTLCRFAYSFENCQPGCAHREFHTSITDTLCSAHGQRSNPGPHRAPRFGSYHCARNSGILVSVSVVSRVSPSAFRTSTLRALLPMTIMSACHSVAAGRRSTFGSPGLDWWHTLNPCARQYSSAATRSS